MSENKGKRAARERLQEQRRRERNREKRRRTLIVAAASVAVLGVAAAVGVVVNNAGGDEEAERPVASPKNASGEDGLAIPAGRADAPSTLTVYEDFRCPACGQFENGFRDTIHKLQAKGLLKTDYHLATIIDGNMGGSGSKNAANAAACAQDAGKFTAYHDVLYKNQPQETDDAFADKKRLIGLAGQVKGLDTPSFRKCVTSGEHDGWVGKVTAAFTKAGHQGTPTVLLNGKNVYADQQNPLTPASLEKLVTAAAEK